MGLFDFLRGKPDEDPILGGRSAEPSGLEVSPVEGGTWTQTSRATAHSQLGDAPMDPGDLVRTLQEAGGDPQRIAAQLQQMFPGAHIDVQQSTSDGGAHPDMAQVMQTFFGGAAQPLPSPPAAATDPIAQIERLAELHQRGALTDAEFAAAKAKLLGS